MYVNCRHPVPLMPLEVWEVIRNAELHDGGWKLDDEHEAQLFLERESSLGDCRWALYPLADAPRGLLRVPISSAERWAVIKGGTLCLVTNTITRGPADYQLQLELEGIVGRGALAVANPVPV